MHKIIFSLIVLAVWPLLVSALAFFFHRKQNGSAAWTGGPISWPKSFWLAYTVTCWFLMPLLFFIDPQLTPGLKIFYIFHLVSWWLRGPLELFMIYKWLNWSPRYGIGHDLFHVFGCIGIIAFYFRDFSFNQPVTLSVLAACYSFVVVFSTMAEIIFATLFLKFRDQQESLNHIYFASNDPKWLLINRLTFTVVTLAMAHLLIQSYWAIHLVRA